VAAPPGGSRRRRQRRLCGDALPVSGVGSGGCGQPLKPAWERGPTPIQFHYDGQCKRFQKIGRDISKPLTPV
jgi:hypothetical protein